MDASRLKVLDKTLGTPLLVVAALWNRLVGLIAPGRVARGRKLEGLARIAVVKTVAVGDLVAALPTLAALRTRFSDAHITLVTTPRVRQVVEGLPDVDDILYYDVFGIHGGLVGILRFLRLVRARRFDAWIELEHYYRFTTLLGYLSGARVRVGFDIAGQWRGPLFTVRVDYPADSHEVEAFHAVALALGVTEPVGGLVPIPVRPEDEAAVDRWVAERSIRLDQGLVLLHTTTSPVATARRWLDDRWIALAEVLSKECDLLPVLTGAPEDAGALERLADRIGAPVVVAAGELDLKGFAVLAGRAKLVVSLDTGPLHIAAAAGTPTVGLFGPNTPAKWGPYGEGHAAVWAALPCSPCTRQYLGEVSSCTEDDCMRAISVEDVLDAIASLPSKPCPGPLESR